MAPEKKNTKPASPAQEIALDQDTAKARGRWTFLALRGKAPSLIREVARHKPKSWDLREAVLDCAGASLFWQAWGGKTPGEILLTPAQETLFSRLEGLARESLPAPPRFSPIASLGEGALWGLSFAASIVASLGEIVSETLALVLAPFKIPLKELSAIIAKAGAEALFITALVGFLIGVVISYLSAQQLELFGADIFIINLVGFAVLRELGPLLAAILVAGRSGSAMAAELGVMRVTQEMDALAAFGISTALRLLWPRILGLALVMPLLVVWTDAASMTGAILSSQIKLGVGFAEFYEILPSQVPIANFWIGLVKGLVFGFFIALVATVFGMRILPNTESLGRGTTNSVVAGITIVILLDAIFAILFMGVGMP